MRMNNRFLGIKTEIDKNEKVKYIVKIKNNLNSFKPTVISTNILKHQNKLKLKVKFIK
jgi:hypothetical protein